MAGLSGLGASALGVGCAFALFFPQWMLKWIGGGDAKLFMVVGSFLGPVWMLDVVLLATACNGLVSLAFAAARQVEKVAGKKLLTDFRVPMALAILAGFALSTRFGLLHAG
ncbi:MAG: prepilin peptidase [Alphaproteobacteria bacterium]|nr:prepilin peptidase [Alphaproteobacteria bacterium]